MLPPISCLEVAGTCACLATAWLLLSPRRAEGQRRTLTDLAVHAVAWLTERPTALVETISPRDPATKAVVRFSVAVFVAYHLCQSLCLYMAFVRIKPLPPLLPAPSFLLT